MEADKNEFNIYRQPSLSDIITMPPSETWDHQQFFKTLSSHRNKPTTEVKQDLGPITITALCYIEKNTNYLPND